MPPLNTPVLFPFGGETHKINFPLFVDNFARKMCCFFCDFQRRDRGHSRNRMEKSAFAKWYSVQIGHSSWTKSQNERQTSNLVLFCPPNSQSERCKVDTSTFWKCSKQIFSKIDSPKNNEKSRHFIFSLGDLDWPFHLRSSIVYLSFWPVLYSFTSENHASMVFHATKQTIKPKPFKDLTVTW